MNVTAILVAALVVGGVGILIGFFLGISGEKFKVEVDEKEVAILGELPGNNCVVVVMPDVPDLLQRSQKVKHQSTSVRSAELQLQLRSVQSWV